MKNKFNVGDKVVYIYKNDHPSWEVSNEIVEEVILREYGNRYAINKSLDEAKEKDLYTKEEAIEFLKGVLK